MEDPANLMYRRAIDSGITDGMARGLRSELRTFKYMYYVQAPEGPGCYGGRRTQMLFDSKTLACMIAFID